MSDFKTKVISKKQHAKNLKELHTDRATAAERAWLKGYKTTTEQDILAASKK